MPRLTKCPCGSREYPDIEVDGYGIFMFYCCDKCRKGKLSKFRSDIFTQYACEEPIEEDY